MSWGKRHPNNVEIWRRNFWSHVSQGQLEGNGGFWHERLWWKRKKDILRLEACLSAQHWSDSSSTFWDVATGTNVLWRAPVEGHSNTDPRWKDGETHGKGCGDCKSIATSGERTSKKGPLQPVSVNYIANSLQNALLQALLYMIGKLIEIRAKNVLILLQFEFVCHPFSLLKSTLNWYIPHCPTSPFVRTCQPERRHESLGIWRRGEDADDVLSDWLGFTRYCFSWICCTLQVWSCQAIVTYNNLWGGMFLHSRVHKKIPALLGFVKYVKHRKPALFSGWEVLRRSFTLSLLPSPDELSEAMEERFLFPIGNLDVVAMCCDVAKCLAGHLSTLLAL